jgi:hypothetical protein
MFRYETGRRFLSTSNSSLKFESQGSPFGSSEVWVPGFPLLPRISHHAIADLAPYPNGGETTRGSPKMRTYKRIRSRKLNLIRRMASSADGAAIRIRDGRRLLRGFERPARYERHRE